MEALVIFSLLFLGVILIGSIMGLTSSGAISQLQRENKNLNVRLEALENAQAEGRLEPTALSITDPAPIKEPEANVDPEAISAPIPYIAPKPASVSPPAPVQAAAVNAAQPAQKFLPPKPKKPSRNLEELIGGQWSVWVGGLALLVGAVLLIRFSIEAGIFGPGARIMMALVLGAVLLLAGEWLKRADDEVLTGRLGEAAKALQGNASVPGLLSAVGVFTLLGATYAAHALYGLIPAFAAFIALGVISLGAMALSLRQGPLLAGIGLLASLATPLLIQTNTPSLFMLIVYLVLVGGAALFLARRTGWGWLATGTVFGWLGWSFMTMKAATGGQLFLWSAFLALGFVVTVWFANQHIPNEAEEESDTEEESSAEDDIVNIDWDQLNLQTGTAIIWAALAATAVWLVSDITRNSTIGLPMARFALGLISIGALTAASVVFKKQSAHLVTAGLLALGFLVIAKAPFQSIILMLSIVSLVGLSFWNAKPSEDDSKVDLQLAWDIFAVVLGLLSVVVLAALYPADKFDLLHTAIALTFAGFFAAASLWFRTRGAGTLNMAIPVLGAGAAWTLASVFGFEDLGFSLFMSLGATLAALTIWQVRMAGARVVLLGLAGLIFAHALCVQFPDKNAIATLPVFNALWIYLALPSAILAGAAYVLYWRKEEGAVSKLLDGAIEAAALAGFALFAVFQIRHLSNGGEVYADSLGHAELGLQTSIGLCFTLAGLSKRFSGNLVLSKIAEIISYVTLVIFALGSLLIFSPFFRNGETISGNVFFNSLTTGLLVPTFLLGACAVMARGKRTEPYINILGGLALAGALSWVTAMIRFIFNGPRMNVWFAKFSAMELWTISAVWLAFGVGLLALGVWRKEQALRIASGVVIILTVLKAFLIDMSGLEGVLRALSFVALGLILIVIGRAYQRFWLSDNSGSGAKAE